MSNSGRPPTLGIVRTRFMDRRHSGHGIVRAAWLSIDATLSQHSVVTSQASYVDFTSNRLVMAASSAVDMMAADTAARWRSGVLERRRRLRRPDRGARSPLMIVGATATGSSGEVVLGSSSIGAVRGLAAA
jgi:hypothetical protein